MCIILDVNSFADLRNENNQDMLPARKWLDNKNGKIAYCNTAKFRNEWQGKMQIQLKDWSREGKVKFLGQEDTIKVQKEANQLQGKIQSDDEHIIALAMIAKVKVLISKDQALHQDFKAKIPDGSIYQKKKHKHLLDSVSCP